MGFKIVYLGTSSLCNSSINSKNFRLIETEKEKKKLVYLQFGESAKSRERRIGNFSDHVVTQISEMDNMHSGLTKQTKLFDDMTI